MKDKPKESDWKAFRKMVPDLRERYLKEKNREIKAILEDESRTPTEQFWDTREIIEKERKILVDCFDGHSRSKMFSYMLLMHRAIILKEEDLSEFSESLQEGIKRTEKGVKSTTDN